MSVHHILRQIINNISFYDSGIPPVQYSLIQYLLYIIIQMTQRIIGQPRSVHKQSQFKLLPIYEPSSKLMSHFSYVVPETHIDLKLNHFNNIPINQFSNNERPLYFQNSIHVVQNNSNSISPDSNSKKIPFLKTESNENRQKIIYHPLNPLNSKKQTSSSQYPEKRQFQFANVVKLKKPTQPQQKQYSSKQKVYGGAINPKNVPSLQQNEFNKKYDCCASSQMIKYEVSKQQQQRRVCC